MADEMTDEIFFENLHISAENCPISFNFGRQMYISILMMDVNKKIEIFQIQYGGRTPYWKSFFGYISAPYWTINAKFETEMKDHMLI